MRTEIIVLLTLISAAAYIAIGVGVQRLAKGFSRQMSEGLVILFAWPIALIVVAMLGDSCRDN